MHLGAFSFPYQMTARGKKARYQRKWRRLRTTRSQTFGKEKSADRASSTTLIPT